MQKNIQTKVPVKLAFRTVGQELLKEKEFRTAFNYFKRSGLSAKESAMKVLPVIIKSKKANYGLELIECLGKSKPELIEKGMMRLKIAGSMETLRRSFYYYGVRDLIEGGMAQEKASSIGASYAFRNKDYPEAARMFEAAAMEEEARIAWKKSADSEIKKGAFSEAAKAWMKSGEKEKAIELLLYNDKHEDVVRLLLEKGKKIREACAIVAECLEGMGKIELAAHYSELSWNFENAKELYRKMGNSAKIGEIDTFKEANKGWCYVSEYKRLGASQESM